MQEVYRLIILLNSSLQFIVSRLEELASVKILSPAYLKELKELTNKVQTGMDAVTKPTSKP
jgi:hypothetical protein